MPPTQVNMSDKLKEIPRLVKDSQGRQYFPGDILGYGGFASVWRARAVDRRKSPHAPECALKVVRTQKITASKQLRLRFKLELAIHSKLNHPNVVRFHRAFSFGDLTYVALELSHNGSLSAMVKARKYLTMGEIRRFMIQLCGAVKYLHGRDVVHRDIKAGNVLLDETMNVKLADFGLAAYMEPSLSSNDPLMRVKRTTFCGTPNYLAPELLGREGHDKTVDIWAIGILAYFLAVGRGPFHASTRDEMYSRIGRGEFSWPGISPESNEIPEDLKGLVASILVKDSHRPSPDTIVQHAFFTHGYIFSKLTSLARTRAPRVSRAATRTGDGTSPSETYVELCRSAGVGPMESTVPTTSMRPMYAVLWTEFQANNALDIPLPEGVVYEAPEINPKETCSRRGRGMKSVSKKKLLESSTPVIFEDQAGEEDGELPSKKDALVLQESSGNKGLLHHQARRAQNKSSRAVKENRELVPGL